MAGPGLHQLYPPEGSSIATSFDIVAIHGLGGDAFQTWTYHDTDGRKIMNGGPDPMWIQDFLKKDFPHARIFTYGYTTGDSFFSNIVSGIGDYARDLMARLQGERFDVEKPGERPILFICHSLGGIVLKQALISAHDRSNRHEWILDVPKAVIFMGTPHRGAPIAAYLKFAGKRLPGFPRDWVTVLEPRSKPLEEMMDRFVQMGSKLVDIVSFYETETPWWLDKAVVERASTMLYQENETPLMLSGDHKQICRYSSEADPNYKLVKIQIRRIVTIVFKLAPPVITAIPPPQPPPTTTSNSISRALTWPSRESISEVLALAGKDYDRGNFHPAYKSYQEALVLLLDNNTEVSDHHFPLTYNRLAKCALNMSVGNNNNNNLDLIPRSSTNSDDRRVQEMWLSEAERFTRESLECARSPKANPEDEYRAFSAQLLCQIRREEMDSPDGRISEESRKRFADELNRAVRIVRHMKDAGCEVDGLLDELRWIGEKRLMMVLAD